MKKMILAVMTAAMVAVALPAMAQEKTVLGANPYVGLNTGLGFQSLRGGSFDVGVAGGLNWTNFRTEVAYDGGFQNGNSGYNLGSVNTNAFMWKNYIQAPVNIAGRKWEPYAMGGLGLGLLSGAGATRSSDMFYTLGAGVRTGLGQGFSLGLGYEYVISQNTDVVTFTGTDYYRSNNVSVRLAKTF